MTSAETRPHTPYPPFEPSPWTWVTGGSAAVVGSPLIMNFVARSAEVATTLAQSNAHEVYAQAGVGEALNHALNAWSLAENTLAFAQKMADSLNVLHSPAILVAPLAIAVGERLDPNRGDYTENPTSMWIKIARTIHIPLALLSAWHSYGVIENIDHIAHNISYAITHDLQVPVPEFFSLAALPYAAFSLLHAGKRIYNWAVYPNLQKRREKKKTRGEGSRAALAEEIRPPNAPQSTITPDMAVDEMVRERLRRDVDEMVAKIPQNQIFGARHKRVTHALDVLHGRNQDPPEFITIRYAKKTDDDGTVDRLDGQKRQ